MNNLKKIWHSLFIKQPSIEEISNQEKTQITSLLDNLGNSAEEVALSLSNLNIKGLQMNSRQCPISNYLRSKYQNMKFLAVSSVHITFKITNENLAQINTSKPIEEFITNFDIGKFQELIASEKQ
jgi:hypothetical protein